MNFNNTAILLQKKGRKKLSNIKVRLWDAFMGKFFSFEPMLDPKLSNV